MVDQVYTERTLRYVSALDITLRLLLRRSWRRCYL